MCFKFWSRVSKNVLFCCACELTTAHAIIADKTKTDYFDAVIMDFVDENCIVFDSEEENKFIYTDLHNQFKDHVRYPYFVLKPVSSLSYHCMH